MHSKDLFNLAIRLLGLVFLYHGLRDLPLALAQIAGSFPHEIGRGVRTIGSFRQFVGGIFMVAWPLLVSYWLLRGAPLIQRLAFPQPPSNGGGEPATGTGPVHH